jgi:hypothetical protein
MYHIWRVCLLHDFQLQIAASYKTQNIPQNTFNVFLVKVGLGYACHSSTDYVGFVFDKVTLALVFPQNFGFLGTVSFHQSTT